MFPSPFLFSPAFTKDIIYSPTYAHTCARVLYLSKAVMVGVKNHRGKATSRCVALGYSPAFAGCFG